MIRSFFRLYLLAPVMASVAAAVPLRAQQAPSADTAIRLTLGGAIRLASHQNAAVEGAQTRVSAARARVTQRRAEFLPNLSAAIAEHGSTINSATFPIDFPTVPGQPALFDPRGTILGPVNAFDARARVSQTLFDPAARARIETARLGVDAASADAGNVADLAASAAANAYLAVLRADAVYTARLQDSTLAAELVGIAQDQLKAGTGIALDVTRARSQLTGARSQLIAARNDRDRTRVDLGRVLGVSQGQIELSDTLASLSMSASADQAAVLLPALQARKDVAALELQAKAARLQAGSIRRERLGTVGLFADEGLSQRNGRSYLPTYDWGVQLSIPLFDGLRREGREEEQLSVARELDVRARDLREQVTADVRIATLNLRSSGEAVGAARERLALAEQEVAQARERFQAGVSGNADAITASLTLNTARTQLVDALTSYQSARVALARAQGSISTLQ